jgi:hypothetical protein
MDAALTSLARAAPAAIVAGTLTPGGTRELHLETLRHDPTNSAAYDYLAMMADEADPIEYFAQVAALAAEEEAREAMQAPLPPLWPRVLHLLVDLKLPPNATPEALISAKQLPAILRAVRSSDEHLQTLGVGVLARFTEDRIRAGEVPLEVLTWLGRVLWCSESLPSLVQAVTIIWRLADVPSDRLGPFLRAAPPVVPRLVTLIKSEDARLAESVMSALTYLIMNGSLVWWEKVHELNVIEAMDSYVASTDAVSHAARPAS